MHLSISNSKSLFWIIVVCCFLAMSICYNTFIVLFKPDVNTIQDLPQMNYAACQRFIYNHANSPVVMIGSSMSAKIEKDMLPEEIYNLSFAGGGVLTGLEILNRSKAKPQLVAIESNLIDTQKDKELLKRLYIPILWQIRGKIISLQSEYQPLNLILSFVRKNIGQSYEEKFKSRTTDQKVLKSMLAIGKERYSHEPNLSDVITELERQTKEIERRGAKIVFYEMPLHTELSTAVRMNYIRSTIGEFCKGNGYVYFPVPDSSKYETTDSIHLTFNSIKKYLPILLEDIKKVSMGETEK